MRDALIIDYNFLDLIFGVACFFPLYFQEIIFFILTLLNPGGGGGGAAAFSFYNNFFSVFGMTLKFGDFS